MLLRLPGDDRLLDAIAFNIDLDSWPNERIQRVRAAFSLDVNEFRGRRSLQLLVRHLQAL